MTRRRGLWVYVSAVMILAAVAAGAVAIWPRLPRPEPALGGGKAPGPEKTAPPEVISPALREAMVSALAGGGGRVNLSVAAVPERLAEAAAAIGRLGGTVLARSDAAGYLAAEVPAASVGQLAATPGVQSLDLIGKVVLGPGSAPDAPDLGLRFFPALEATGAPKVRAKPGGDGRGILLAVIDTGADPGHPDLYSASGGGVKIADWADFSGEGDVRTEQELRVSGGRLETAGYAIPSGLSRSGRYRFGFFRESGLSPQGHLKGDIDRNGVKGESFGVVVYDSAYPGIYDRVIVDANNNRDFTDDQPMGVFRLTREVSWFGRRAPDAPPGERVSFVVTRIDADGAGVNLGFDGHGHGTQTAAVAAANPAEPGRTPGVAPGAELMVLKALDSSGDGSWANISRAMIYAAEHGARIVSLSVAGEADRSGGGSAENLLISRLSRIHNTLFVIAAGNEGPALGSSSAPGEPGDSLTVGSYFTPAMWREYYGFTVNGDTISEFSGVGPRSDGGLAPNLVAPGSSAAAAPFWQAETGKAVADGTSVAAPHAAGSAAVLWSAARAAGKDPGFRQIKRLLEMGARPLDGYSAAEQGHGAVDLAGSYSLIGSLRPERAVETGLGYGEARGLVSYGSRPGRQPVRLRGVWGENLNLRLNAGAPWLAADRPGLWAPAGGERSFNVDYRLPETPGLYSGFLYGDDPAYFGREAELLSTVVVPYRLEAGNGFRRRLTGALEAARVKRFFFEVPLGIDGLVLSAKVPPKTADSSGGGLRVWLTPPDRRKSLGPLPVGSAAASFSQSLRYQVSSPAAGVWEVAIFCPPEVSLEGNGATEYEIEVSLTGAVFPDGVIRIGAAEGESGPKTVRTRVAAAQSTVSGRMVAAGFGRPGSAAVTESVTLSKGESKVLFFPDAGPDAVALRAKAEPGVDASLWYFDSGAAQWREVPVPAEYRLSPGDFTVPPPWPGRYLVLLSARNLTVPEVTVRVEREVLADTGDIQPEASKLILSAGETRQAELRVNLPAEPGRYYGRVSVWDDSGESILGSAPAVLDRSQPELYLRARLVPEDRSAVWLEVREDGSNRPVAAWIILAGARYWAEGGRLFFRPAEAGLPGPDEGFRASVDDRRYRFWEGTVTPPARISPPDEDPGLERLGRRFEELMRN